jgi:hypothetical protein
MMRTADPNLAVLARAVACLGPLVDRMVFLGGCATALFLTDPAAPEVRPTQDVDVITEVGSLADYYRLADDLRAVGFVEDQSPGAPLCRWRASGVILDVMPTDERVFGFGNRWYRPALVNAQLVVLPAGERIRTVTAPYFLATKLEAFAGRGIGDYLASPDLEDVITVTDGRPEIVEEVLRVEVELRLYLAERFSALLATRSFLDALAAYLPPDAASQGRLPIVLDRLHRLANQQP